LVDFKDVFRIRAVEIKIIVEVYDFVGDEISGAKFKNQLWFLNYFQLTKFKKVT